MIRPRRLRPGDRLAIVAPASPFARVEFDAGVTELRRLGFDPVFDDRVFARAGYVAGDADLRASALVEALEDPSVAGLVAARGGYGSVEVLPKLPPRLILEARKPIVGYSDVTSLLAFTIAQGLVSFHGPTVAGRLSGGVEWYDEASFTRVLTSATPLGCVASGLDALRPGTATGPLVGGNLTQLAASLGTPYSWTVPRGAVLLFEDVNERPYRLERLWTQLLFAGLIERASAIVLGDFPGCDEPEGSPTAIETWARLTESFPGPVVYGLRCGHTRGPALTLPLGVQTRVEASTGRVTVEDPAVE